MRMTIRAESAEVAGSRRAALDEAGDFELSEVGERSVGVVASAGDVAALAAALSGWWKKQPPGSEMTVETSTQVLTMRAGDARAAIALNEAVEREGRAAEEAAAQAGAAEREER